MTAQEAETAGWHEIVRDTLKRNEVKLVTYVPDNVLTPLIKARPRRPLFHGLRLRRARRRRSASSPAPGWAACAASC